MTDHNKIKRAVWWHHHFSDVFDPGWGYLCLLAYNDQYGWIREGAD